MQTESKRPLGITIIIVWFALEGIYYFYSNSLGIFGGNDTSALFSGTMTENAITAVAFAFGLFNFAMIWAFLERKPWARMTTIIVSIVAIAIQWIVTSMGYFTIFSSVIATIVIGIIIAYLFKPNAKQYFAKSIERK